VAFYNQLINALVAHDITPYVTLFHSDMPLALTMYAAFRRFWDCHLRSCLSSSSLAEPKSHDVLCMHLFGRYPRLSNPFLSDDFPALFANYADVAFREFGDRVKVHAPPHLSASGQIPYSTVVVAPYLAFTKPFFSV
jgi:beta-glucosidase/6-phospho-beta-glucosidase/beta-galactosidase